MNKLRIIAVTLSIVLIFCVAGCEKSEAGGKSIIVTTDALYEIVSAVAGDRFEVINLLSGGEEIHHFEPTAQDAKALADARLIIYNGLGLDDWAEELAGETEAFAAAERIPVILDNDPHAWLSPASASSIALAVCEKLQNFDPDGQTVFEANCNAFTAQLSELTNEFFSKFAEARLDTFVTGHAALGYLAAQFGLTQKSVSDVFSSSEPTAQQLMELTSFCNKNGVKYVLSESSAPLAVSETLANECGAEVLPVFMMESAEGGTFIERMRHNLEAVLLAIT